MIIYKKKKFLHFPLPRLWCIWRNCIEIGLWTTCKLKSIYTFLNNCSQEGKSVKIPPPHQYLNTWYLIYLLLTIHIFQKSISYFEIGNNIYLNKWLVLSIDVTFRSTRHFIGITVEINDYFYLRKYMWFSVSVF